MAEDYTVGADYAASMTEIGKRFDFQGQQLTEISKKLDEQDLALYDQRAILSAHGRDLATVSKRLEKMEGRLDGMATKQDFARLESMMGEILAGNTQQSEIMLQVLAKLSERGE